MEPQSFAQRQPPQPAVGLDRVALHHLRLRREVVIQPVERVEDEIAVGTGERRVGEARV